MKALELQDLLVHCRKELIDLNKEVANHNPEKQPSELEKQVKAEIAKKMATLGLKG